jgi:hypothetical protein
MTWRPYKEPLRATVARTVAIAVVVGAIIGLRGGLTAWAAASVLVLWPSFGGHWVEVWFLNWLRPRIPSSRGVQLLARLMVWFLAGVVFLYCVELTAAAFGRGPRWPAWWICGLGFIAVELVAHAGLALLRRPSFYDGRG